MSVVFDTNVLISSTLWDGSVAQKLLFKMILSNIQIYSSADILSEYERVLVRDFGYSEEETKSIVEKVLSFTALVQPKETVDAVKDDPDDNKIIECAVASGSKFIITYDKHLLKIKDFGEIRIITPEDALKIF